MDTKEATEIIEILCEADSGCNFCAERLIKKFNNKFPEHKELAIKIFKSNFDGIESSFTD